MNKYKNNNPVLNMCVGLCSVIIGSTSLLNSLITSVFLITDIVVISIIACLFLKKIPRYFRVAIYFLIGCIITYPLLLILENYTDIYLSTSLKICISLIPIGSATALICEKIAVKANIAATLKISFFSGVSISIIMIILGFLRELISQNTIFGEHIDIPFKFESASLPFSCLILLGFIAVIFKLFSFNGGNDNENDI